MAIHYIIDGYNVIKQVSFLTGRKLQHGREGLVKFIETYKPHGSARNQVTVVFDGQEDVVSPNMKTQVKVIFSSGKSADDVIKKKVEQAKNPRTIVVVSDDKEIKFYCRSVGAKVLSVKEFVGNAKISKKPHKKQKSKKVLEEKADLDNNVASKITEDLKKLWVKEDEKESWY
jgi:predicted RNA-binding protein with PIN domain